MGKVLGEAINYEKLRINGYDLECIKELKIESEINKHSALYFTGILKNQLKDEDIFNTTSNKTVEVYYDDEKKTIFYGIVTNIKVDVKEDIYYISVEAKSMTYLMDIKVKSRSFQNKNMTTHSLFNYIMKEYGISEYILDIPDVPIGELLVQYEETDWQFINRIISKYNMVLIIRMYKNHISYVVGLSDDDKKEECIINRKEFYRGLSEYENMKENYLDDAKSADYLTCSVISYDIVNIGNSINILNQKFYVYRAVYEIKDSVLVNDYKLRIKNGLRQKKLFNTKIVGTSIRGKIIDVKNELVKVHLKIDDDYKDKEDVFWFKFSTMSASSDGSGWYYMPEIGDDVRVYFPTKDEDQCFAISAVSGYVQGATEKEDRMGNPDDKYLRNPSDKEVKLTNDGIFISCNSGQGALNFTNDGNLNISSANNINIIADEAINITAANDFKITAENEINICSEKGGIYCITPDGEIIQSGAQLKNN